MKHWKWAVLGAAVLLIGILHLDRAVPANGWGLSFQTPGGAPAGPVSQEKLGELGGAYLDPDGGKVLYLTFDAGYENGYTEKILDTLKEREVPAAFFLVGDYLERNADLVRRMTAEGHIVGNHTFHHPETHTGRKTLEHPHPLDHHWPGGSDLRCAGGCHRAVPKEVHPRRRRF